MQHTRQEVILKPACRRLLPLLFIVFLVTALSSQDDNQSLGDVARQERERKQKQASNPADDSSETNGLKEADFKASILITDSHAAIEKWVLMSEADRPGAGRIRQLTRDKKFFMPFVVTGYSWPVSERMDLSAHVRLIGPDGKTRFNFPRFSETVGPDKKSPSVIVLNPVMDITFDSGDAPGQYTIRVTITDHVHSAYARAEEQFQLVEGTSAQKQGAEKPVSSQTEPH